MCLKVQRGQLEKEIAGALSSAIAAHGPITEFNRSFAAKRIIATLKVLGVFKEDNLSHLTHNGQGNTKTQLLRNQRRTPIVDQWAEGPDC